MKSVAETLSILEILNQNPMNTKTVILTTCDDAFKAHVLEGALESEGIESILHNERACNLMPNMNGIMGMGVQVLVLEEDYEAALKVLEIDQPRDGNKCPYCGSVDIASSLGKRQGLKAFFALLSALATTPLGNIKRGFHCNHCGEDFTTPV